MQEFDDKYRPIIRSDLRTGRRCHDQKGRVAAIISDSVLKGMFHPGYRVSLEVLQILSYLDGKTELRGFPDLLHAKLGIRLSLEAIQKVIANLAHYDLLDTPETRLKRATLEDIFRQNPIRPMCDPSGTFYPTNSEILKRAIQKCILSAQTDGNGKGKNYRGFSRVSSSPAAFLLPHGALYSSGYTTARALQALLFTPLPDRYILIGPNHVYPGPPCATTISHPFQTPLGVVEIDKEMISLLEKSAEGSIIHDYISQYRDHSIEIILPFLQWIHNQSTITPGKPVRIVPLLLTGEPQWPGAPELESHTKVGQHIGRAIANMLTDSQQITTVIVSGDFLHKGPLFNFVPFSGIEKKDFYAWDRPLVQAIEESNAERLVDAYQISNCCVGRPMYVALKALEGYSWFMIDYHVAHMGENGTAFASFIAYYDV